MDWSALGTIGLAIAAAGAAIWVGIKLSRGSHATKISKDQMQQLKVAAQPNRSLRDMIRRMRKNDM